ncbi:MAG: hypothetical protein QOH14_36 [Pseudonocardiales bacterium]|nr:hypothetical protein [Pseudonocardiales bacterium]
MKSNNSLFDRTAYCGSYVRMSSIEDISHPPACVLLVENATYRVRFEHSPISDRPGYSLLVFREPDDVQVELMSAG